ncbi:MAG: hypothetical protein FJ265_09500, partial [Planctomycetes bacterium]|nr:hypothetical protein [Planctomycetota bacterium]
MARALSAVAPFAATALLAAQQQQSLQLQPIDMFRLDYLMVAGAEQPKGWIDAERYLMFDAGPG